MNYLHENRKGGMRIERKEIYIRWENSMKGSGPEGNTTHVAKKKEWLVLGVRDKIKGTRECIGDLEE
jgi:hypothetical protein